MKRLLLLTLLFVIVVPMLVFAGGSKEAEGKKEKLTYWDWLDYRGDDPRQVARAKVFEEFAKQHPEIELEVSIIPPSLINSKLIEAATTKSSPDVAGMFDRYEAMHVEAGSIAPITQYADQLYRDDYLMAWEETGFYDGEKYTVPWELRAFVLYYRQDLLDEAGIEVPKTWEEVGEAGRKLRTKDRFGFVIGLSEADLGNAFGEWFESAILGAGGDLFDKDGYPLWVSDAGEKTFQFLYDLIYKYEAMDRTVLGYTYDNVTDAMKAGTAAMVVLGSHRLETIRSGGLGDKVQTAPLPGFEGYGVPSPATPSGWTLGLGGNPPEDHRDAAIKFINFLKSVEGELIMAASGELPTRKSTWNDPRIADIAPDFNTRSMWKDYILNDSQELYRAPQSLQAQVTLAEAVNEMILNHTPPKVVLERAAQKYISILED